MTHPLKRLRHYSRIRREENGATVAISSLTDGSVGLRVVKGLSGGWRRERECMYRGSVPVVMGGPRIKDCPRNKRTSAPR
jgi:hypothetical protein